MTATCFSSKNTPATLSQAMPHRHWCDVALYRENALALEIENA